MAYQTPDLTLHGSASNLVLGTSILTVAPWGDHVSVGVPPRKQGYSRITEEI